MPSPTELADGVVRVTFPLPFGQPVSVLAKYPQPVSSDMWLTLIDSDHTCHPEPVTKPCAACMSAPLRR